jgi:hypothetical protein
VKSFLCERENMFVLNSLINFEPAKKFKNSRNVMNLVILLAAQAAAFRTSCRHLV